MDIVDCTTVSGRLHLLRASAVGVGPEKTRKGGVVSLGLAENDGGGGGDDDERAQFFAVGIVGDLDTSALQYAKIHGLLKHNSLTIIAILCKGFHLSLG